MQINKIIMRHTELKDFDPSFLNIETPVNIVGLVGFLMQMLPIILGLVGLLYCYFKTEK